MLKNQSPLSTALPLLASWGTPTEQVSRRRRSGAALVEHCETLLAQALARQVGAGVDPSLWLVNLVVEGRAIHQEFSLESRLMPWGGGSKFFFRCSCGRRCAKLYLPPQGTQFACRRCHRLLYFAQRYKTRRSIKSQ